MTSISLFHPDNAPASRDAKSCVSRLACHSFFVRSLHVHSSAVLQYRRKILRLPFSMSFLHCQVVVRVFLSLMLVRRKILRLYFCLMEFIVKRHVRRHYATCKRIMRQRCIVTSVARLCLFGVALFFLTYFICADIFILYLCIKWSSARQCQVR